MEKLNKILNYRLIKLSRALFIVWEILWTRFKKDSKL